jgi:methyl-accepting chemotaxis protein
MQLTVVARTLGGFTILLVLMLVMAGVAYNTQKTMIAQQSYAQNELSPIQNNLSALSQLILKANKSAMQHLSLNAQDARKKVEQELQLSESTFIDTATTIATQLKNFPNLKTQFSDAKKIADQSFAIEKQQVTLHNQQVAAKQKVLETISQFKEQWRFFKDDSEDLLWELEGDEHESARVALQFMTQLAGEYAAEINAALAITNMDEYAKSRDIQEYRYKNMMMTSTSLGSDKDIILAEMSPYFTMMEKSINETGNLYKNLERYLTLVEQSQLSVIQLNNSVNLAEQKFQELTTAMAEQIKAINTESEAHTNRATMILLVIITISIISTLIVGWTTLQSIRNPMKEILQSLKLMAAGDLRVTLKSDSKDEFGQIAAQINTLKYKLITIVNSLNTVANDVTQVAEKTSEFTLRAEQRIESQRQESDAIATAIAEIDTSVSEVADNTQLALDEVKSMEVTASDNRQRINDNIATTNNLNQEMTMANDALIALEQEMNGISSIVHTIQKITGQTNLLALNAAIEAARAGAHGRGFAVVADEVRSLATLTQSATEEIESLVDGLHHSTQKTVSCMNANQLEANKMAEQAVTINHSFTELQDAIARVHQSNMQISLTTKEQTNFTHELNRNIGKIVEMTESLADESSSSSERAQLLLNLANQQKSLIEEFKL